MGKTNEKTTPNHLSDQQIALFIKNSIIANSKSEKKPSTKIKSIYENANDIQKELIDEVIQALCNKQLKEILEPPRFERLPEDTPHVGSSGASEYIDLSPAKLIQVFGPKEESDGYKVSGEYRFRTFDGGLITLYDWKSTNLYDDDLEDQEEFWASESTREFNLGGDDTGKKHIKEFKEWISGQLNNSVRFIVNDK